MKHISYICLLICLARTGCKDKSTDSNLPEICYVKGEAGPCRAMTPGYYYDQAKRECVEFIWGGCQGVIPFETMDECKATCEK